MSVVAERHSPANSGEKIFSRVLVGIDGSPESFDALRLAAVLKAPGGSLVCVAAWNPTPSLVTPTMVLVPYEEREARSAAEDAVRGAREPFPSARTKVVHGFPARALIDEIVREQSTLVAVGSHGLGRAAGILAGSTTTSLVHGAPCSVLVTRKDGNRLPHRIAVGVDGSTQSAAAYAAARYLADRFDGELNVVVAEGGKHLDSAGVWLIAGDRIRVIADDPVPALTSASRDADLLVVGSRGLHGLKSLGSVSERVAHRAECSMLIVRGS